MCDIMTVVEKDGFRWYVPDDVMWYPALTEHENKEISWVKENFPHGKQFIDIGAHIGLYSIKLSKNFKHIYAIEANPINIFITNKNIHLNGINNITVIDNAIWRTTKMLFFNQDYANVGGPPTNSSFPVAGVPLDAFDFSPDFIKMDIEGGEFEAIYGMKETLKDNHPTMLIEVHQFPGENTLEKFHGIMFDMGYKEFMILDMGNMPTHTSYNVIYK